MALSVIKNIQGLLLTYDIASRSSFEDLNERIKQINDCYDISGLPIIVVGCKLDLEKKRRVSTEEGQQFAEELKCPFLKYLLVLEKE